MAEALSIAGHRIGPNQACFVIAEAGVNHNGDTGLALRLIDAAADAGADAVKFQTFSAERLASAVAGMADYQKRNTGQDISQLEMLKALELDEASWPDLLARCRARGIVFLSSPFDELAADLLDRIDVPAFKIPSGEITNSPYLAHIARLQRPMIVSTGMATMAEIATALDTIAAAGNPPVVLLQCYSDYPSRPEDQNLRVIRCTGGVLGSHGRLHRDGGRCGTGGLCHRKAFHAGPRHARSRPPHVAGARRIGADGRSGPGRAGRVG